MVVEISKIDDSKRTQLRCRLDEDTINLYAEDFRDGVIYPSVVLFPEGDTYYIGDGYHRIEASMLANRTVIDAEIRPGGFKAALNYAAGANDKHGLRRTNADKRKAIQVLLKDPKYCKKSDNQIAKIVHVTHKTVGDVRKDMERSREIPKIEKREFDRNGKTHVMETVRKKANRDKKALADEAEKKRFYVFDYDESPKTLSNPTGLKNALHSEGFLLIVSNPGSIQKVINKMNKHFKYLWMIAIPAEGDIEKNGMWVDNQWKAISVWAKNYPSHLTFGDTVGLTAMDSLDSQGEYIEQLRNTFERIEESDDIGEEIAYTEMGDSGIKIAKGGEI